MTRLYRATTVLALTLAASGLAAQETTLSRLLAAGESWTGTGMFRQALDAPEQTGRCRFDTRELTTATGALLDGRCAGPAGAVDIVIQIEDRGDGQIAGAVDNPFYDEPLQFVGTDTGGSLMLQSREPVPLGEDRVMTDFQLDLVGETGFVLREVVWTDDAEARVLVLDMTFAVTGSPTP